jgi:chromosomal replication initiation ATPase DnaA
MMSIDFGIYIVKGDVRAERALLIYSEMINCMHSQISQITCPDLDDIMKKNLKITDQRIDPGKLCNTVCKKRDVSLSELLSGSHHHRRSLI